MTGPSVQFGVDRLLAGGLAGLPAGVRRVGLITNDAARPAADASVHARRALLDVGWPIVRLFGPEHGLAATAEDGAPVADGVDPLTRLPVISLYGEALRPPPHTLADLDLLLFDIPDIGARFYTYIWTLSHALEACAAAGKPLWVLDRLNPLGGRIDDAEGPLLDEQFVSTFVGRWEIPVRHSLTVGELARLWNAERHIGCDLRVVPCAGWRRDMAWLETGLPWVPTSPAMPSFASALVYPGTCLVEGTNLSEGRGTERPFGIVGAPWVEAGGWAERLSGRRLPGVRFEPVRFVPGGRKFAGEPCEGVRVEPVDRRAFRPVRTGLELLATVVPAHPERFAWLRYETAANRAGEGHFDRLVGRAGVREAIDTGTLDSAGVTAAPGWAGRVGPHLLYPD